MELNLLGFLKQNAGSPRSVGRNQNAGICRVTQIKFRVQISFLILFLLTVFCFQTNEYWNRSQ
jgi:hypothetical protein